MANDADVERVARAIYTSVLAGAGCEAALNERPPEVREIWASAAGAAIAAMSGWQPIETAPKDGTKILVFTIHGELELSDWYKIETPEYVEVSEGLYRKEMREFSSGWNSNHPTHWMPLPEPPA